MIVVAGATGHVGSEVVAQLAAAGEPVRALTRRPDAWQGPDVEVSRDDLSGARAAFLMSSEPVAPGGTPTRLAELVARALDAGVGHLVLLSVFSGPEGADVIGRWNAAREALVVDSGVPWTLLRPGRFFSNALAWARSVPDGGPAPVGFARRAAAGIDPADVAAVAVRALGGDLVGAAPRLTGPESLTPLDELRLLGEVLGRPLPARELGPDDVARGMVAGGTAPEVVDAILARTLGSDEGVDPLPTVRELLGREPRRFVDWARAHADAFGAVPS
ncbi:NAD(P)H-binding protein [Actinomycetospora termitidis]|uniref:NAD(P)H-binding protein n=1 Tax=Actinomycetospora termitidis TaxID=3053470 RepID=A0ABT7MAF4_9PSEU|nr:NAD(P)H-binding protein [Actinomycetospora sp. Odt1-22]MDL5157641.1 NAD(P)H-binding protein [Actinomycetospora sp. Odt1-22]